MVLTGVRNSIKDVHVEYANIFSTWHVPSVSIVPHGEGFLFAPVFYVKDSEFQIFCVRSVEWGGRCYMDFHFQHRDDDPELVQLVYGASECENEDTGGREILTLNRFPNPELEFDYFKHTSKLKKDDMQPLQMRDGDDFYVIGNRLGIGSGKAVFIPEVLGEHGNYLTSYEVGHSGEFRLQVALPDPGWFLDIILTSDGNVRSCKKYAEVVA